MESRKLNSAATSRRVPACKAAATVKPERDMPGSSATAWAAPTPSEPAQPGSGRLPRRTSQRVAYTTPPVANRLKATRSGRSKVTEIASDRAIPIKAAGTEASASMPR